MKIPIGIPIGMPATGTGTVGPSEGSFSDIRVGSRAAIWFVPDSISGSSKTAAAILITGKVER
ncbi:MAG TPA: hypothetical protein PK765_07220 [bacterium]|nr:hypothetical protein [bacterium]